MNTMTDYLKKKTLQACLGISVETFPSTVYLAAYNTATTDAGGGTEVIGGGYERQPITFSAPNIVDGQAVALSNASVSFPVADTAWGTITHIALLDASTEGNMLYHGAVTVPKTIEAGDQLKIHTGNFTVYQK